MKWNFNKNGFRVIVLLVLSVNICLAQNPSFEQIIAGVRPRGACKTNYDISIPMPGGKEIYVATFGNDANQGNRQSPMATITEASKKAVAGDVITVANGIYSGGVTIHSNGTQAKPVVIQAENCGGVTLTSSGDGRIQAADWRGGDANSVTQTQNLYITFRGFLITAMHTLEGPFNTNGGNYAAMRISNGWVVSDCVFNNNTVGVDIRAHYPTITKSEFRNGKHMSILGAGNGDGDPGRDWIFSDLLITGNNSSLHDTPHEASVKILYTINSVVDNIESWDNNGPGWWYDWHNSDFTVMNSYLHHNKKGTYDWDAVGYWSEVNDGGIIKYNIFEENVGAGIGLLESKNILIENNLLVNDDIEFRCMNSRGMNMENITIQKNTFLNSESNRSISDNCGQSASVYNVVFDQNTYVGSWNYSWGSSVSGLQGMQSLGWESNGVLGTQLWPLTPDSSLWGNYQPPVADTTSVMLPADGVLQAESADQLSGLVIKPGIGVGFSNGGDWLVWKNLLFSGDILGVEFVYGTIAEMAGQVIELRLDSPSGELIAEITTENTGGWEIFQSKYVEMINRPTGKHDLYMVMVDQTGADWVADVDKIILITSAPVAQKHQKINEYSFKMTPKIMFESESNRFIVPFKTRKSSVIGGFD
jgi:hypothetical protein